MEVLNLPPTLGFYMRYYFRRAIIDAYSNNSTFISPFRAILFKHFLVMSHWCLAWWTPGGPEINKKYLTIFGSNATLIHCININNFSDVFEFVSNINSTLKLNCSCLSIESC